MAEQMSAAQGGTKTWWSRAILIGAVVAVVLLPLGALGSRFGIWSFSGGFMLLAAGTVLAAIGIVAGIAGIIAANRRGLSDDKPAVYLGTLISVLIIGVMGLQFYTASSVPPIHNISTDLNDPPQFERVVLLRGEDSNPLEYDAEKLGPMQLEAYPWVQPAATDLGPDQAFDRALQVLRNMGLDIVSSDRELGAIEATATTFWFGFKDDVAVRIQPDNGGSVVDVRSVSRVGVSDLGANARRIGEFLQLFAAG